MRYSNQGRFRQQVRFLQTPISSGWQFTIHECPLGSDRFASTDSDRRLLGGQDLFAAGYVVGLLRSGFECGSFMSRCSCSLDCPSSVAGPASVLCGDRRLLPSQKASPGEVFLGRGSPDRPRVGNQRRPSLAVETAPSLRLRWIDGDDARYAGKPAGLSATQGAATRPGLSTTRIAARLFSRLWRRA